MIPQNTESIESESYNQQNTAFMFCGVLCVDWEQKLDQVGQGSLSANWLVGLAAIILI